MRDYDVISARVESSGDRTARMESILDAAWESLHAAGVSWMGFYVAEGGDTLVLGPCRDRPACSPIGLAGVCGQALTRRRVLIVDDVETLGDAYIACDPRDRSEIVVPLVDESGDVWGVLDLDAHVPSAFDESDAVGLVRLMRAAGFRPSEEVVRL
ncbi:MAG: GAF domain-containing protein [Planctomycetes bacterium]|nr:GAF domain-containing protein [Planctomycetota bacterium]